MKRKLNNAGLGGRALLLGTATALMLSGCATGNMTRSDWGKCIGAVVLGAGAGALLEGERGAYVGAAAGVAACLVINAQSKRTRSASDVESDYRAIHASLPAQPEVLRYATELPNSGIRRGEPLTIISHIETVSGSQQPITQVREQVRLYEPGNTEPFKSTEKVASESAGSGGYQNTFTINFPKNFPQGRYNIETDLFINGKKVDQNNSPIQVVFDGTDVLPLHSTLASR